MKIQSNDQQKESIISYFFNWILLCFLEYAFLSILKSFKVKLITGKTKIINKSWIWIKEFILARNEIYAKSKSVSNADIIMKGLKQVNSSINLLNNLNFSK